MGLRGGKQDRRLEAAEPAVINGERELNRHLGDGTRGRAAWSFEINIVLGCKRSGANCGPLCEAKAAEALPDQFLIAARRRFKI
jgi:hypothetical protein